MSSRLSFFRRNQLITLGVFIGAAVLAPAGVASAQGAPLAVGSLDRGDRKFVEDAAQGGMAEVALGQLAQQHGSSPQVKAFGQRMVQDHSKANDDLKFVARAKGVQLPSELSAAHRQHADALVKMQGAEFDRAYMKHMLNDHEKDVSDFDKAATSAKDPDVKDFAARTLPTLQAHLKLVQTTVDALK